MKCRVRGCPLWFSSTAGRAIEATGGNGSNTSQGSSKVVAVHLAGHGESGLGSESWTEPPRSRFCLSHFRSRRTTSKPIGSKLVEGQSFATALCVCAIRLLAIADGANRLMTKIMTGFRFGAASAICAGRLHYWVRRNSARQGGEGAGNGDKRVSRIRWTGQNFRSGRRNNRSAVGRGRLPAALDP